jgi:hypothetical protein
MLVLLDVRASDEIRENLLALGFDVLSVPKNSRLDEPVSAHPDMRFFTLGNKIFISNEEKDELSYITSKLEALEYEIIYSSVSISKKYPADIAFNCFTVGKYLFGNLPYLAPEILEEAKRQGYTLISVKQGYSKCSTLIVDDNSIITADPSIYTSAVSAGLDALFINNPDGAIKLCGYSCGFIGGASGVFDNTVYFCGDISKHPAADAIISFCESKNKAPLSLSKEELYDLGSLLFFKKK